MVQCVERVPREHLAKTCGFDSPAGHASDCPGGRDKQGGEKPNDGDDNKHFDDCEAMGAGADLVRGGWHAEVSYERGGEYLGGISVL
jgi:hypothetical protein